VRAFVLLSLAFGAVAVGVAAGSEGASGCVPTRADALGPFYEAGAPVRAKVGTGYVLSGRVLAARTCRPIAKARIELWLANPQGEYDDAHRATMFATRAGRYRFESNRPVAYSGRPPHIHIRVSARGFRTLVTQHYPRGGRSSAVFNLVLRRS
jgi:protocatechuate 3,4-dioxygenase beta subunit